MLTKIQLFLLVNKQQYACFGLWDYQNDPSELPGPLRPFARFLLSFFLKDRKRPAVLFCVLLLNPGAKAPGCGCCSKIYTLSKNCSLNYRRFLPAD